MMTGPSLNYASPSGTALYFRLDLFQLLPKLLHAMLTLSQDEGAPAAELAASESPPKEEALGRMVKS